MLETLTRNWWVLALRGAIAVLFGLLALIWPGITVLALVLLFGAYALVDGVMALYTALFDRGRPRGRTGWLVLEGVAGVLAGIGAVVWPGITALALLYLVAAWALVTGVAEILAAFRLRRHRVGTEAGRATLGQDLSSVPVPEAGARPDQPLRRTLSAGLSSRCCSLIGTSADGRRADGPMY
jgi:uncharacterized membrane protein HdeD (DUF308 family)